MISNENNRQINIRLKPDEYEKIERIANLEKRTKANLVKLIVENYLNDKVGA